MSEDQLAQLLVKAAHTFNERNLLKIHPHLQEKAVKELHSYGVLSINALAAIVGCTEYRVRAALEGQALPEARGKLNPTHIPTLGYMLSIKKNVGQSVAYMVKHGTSISTIEALTGISRATLNRWRKRIG